MRRDGVGRRLVVAMADAAPAFRPVPDRSAGGRARRLLVALADAARAFLPVRDEPDDQAAREIRWRRAVLAAEAPGSASTDRYLLAEYAAGDRYALTELIARHRERLWTVALRTVGNPDEAADALQEGLISAGRAMRSHGEVSDVGTWLQRFVVLAALDRLRRRAARPAVPLPETGPGEPAAEKIRDAEDALLRLPDDERVSIVLVAMGYSAAEIAQLLGVSDHVVLSRIRRGRAKLARSVGHLSDQDTEQR